MSGYGVIIELIIFSRNIHILMEHPMKDFGNKINMMERECSLMKMVIYIEETFKRVWGMEKGFIYKLMVTNTRVTIGWIKETAMVVCEWKMVIFMKVNGLIHLRMVLEYINLRILIDMRYLIILIIGKLL